MLEAAPLGMTAELTDCIVAYWNGSDVAYAFLCENGTDRVDEEFDLDYPWQEWAPEFSAWLNKPRFGSRPEVPHWAERRAVVQEKNEQKTKNKGRHT